MRPKFKHPGILSKLLISFLILSVVPLIVLEYFASKNLRDTGGEAVRMAEEMGRLNLQSAEDIGKTAMGDSVQALDRRSTEAIELRTDELAQRIADFLYERDQDIRILASVEPDPVNYLKVFLASRRDVVDTEAGPVHRSEKPKPFTLESRNPENKEAWRHRPPTGFPKVSRPLYKEITFVNLMGMEKIKIADGKISEKLLDVTQKQNTYSKSEDYFLSLTQLKRGELYVSQVIGEYVRGWLYKTPEGIKVKPGSGYAGRENPQGKRFEGIIRWATPVYDRAGEKIGYITMALDHTHLMEFTEHIVPTEERYTIHPDGGSGNYAFIWDNRDRCISHARDFFICGYDPQTGKEVPGWVSQDTYNQYKKSGLGLGEFISRLPSFRAFTQKKSGSIEQMNSGTISLDCRILDTAPQCQGWHEGTEDGGSGSFLILWSGLWKLTTYATIPYYTGAYEKSKRGFGYVTIGANVEDFHKDAKITKAKIERSILREGDQILSSNRKTRDLIKEKTAHNRQVVTLITVIGGLAVIGTSIVLSLTITRPLRRLTSGAVAISRGNFNQSIEVKSNDEIGQLARSFNEMALAVSEVDKMKSDFVTIASHELRTPIQAMLLGVSGVLEGYSGNIDEEVCEDLMLVKGGIERLMRLVTDLLDLSRIEARKFELNLGAVPVEEIVERAIGEVSELAQAHNHRITRQIPRDLPTIELDRDRMIQVMVNLLSNAIKYSPDNGRILVKVEKGKGDMAIYVADNGYGVPPWAGEEIFKKFFQADSLKSKKVGGTGLGLTISKGIVEMHGGVITCESPLPAGQFPDLPLDEERKGSVFTVRLPLSFLPTS